MTLNRTTNEIKTYDGQVFTTEKFAIDKIRKRVRLLTGALDIVIDQFLLDVIQEFCKKTWILRKLIQVGAILTEVDNDNTYYAVSIDLESYADDLIVHEINEITIDETTYLATKDSYLGDPTGSDEISTVGPGAYIETDTFIGATTYVGATVINDGALTDELNYEIVDDTTIKIWPVNLNNVILVPVIFKTDTLATITEIPYILENYYHEIVSGVISEMRIMPRHGSGDLAFHERNYQKGLSEGKYQYAKQHKRNQIQPTFFAV